MFRVCLTAVVLVGVAWAQDVYLNPDRGQYVQTWRRFGNFVGEEGDGAGNLPPAIETVKSLGGSLIARMYTFNGWQHNAVLDPSWLTEIKSDLALIRQNGLRLLLLFAYTEDINEQVNVDAPPAILQAHVSDLMPIVEANQDVIAVFLHGFMGAYGEMYTTSNYDTDAAKSNLLSIVVPKVPANIPVMVRRPLYYDLIASNSAIANEIGRVGLYDHCILADSSDMGTFADVYDSFTPDIPSIESVMATRFLNIGTSGETCPSSKVADAMAGGFVDCPNVLNHLGAMRTLQLNTDWYNNYTTLWKSNGCWDQILSKLGYVPNIVGTPDLATGITIRNDGFSKPPRASCHYAYAITNSGLSSTSGSVPAIRVNLTNWDIRNLPIGGQTTFPLNIIDSTGAGPAMADDGEVLIAIDTACANNVPNYRIVFTNNKWGPRFNRINVKVQKGQSLAGGEKGSIAFDTGAFALSP